MESPDDWELIAFFEQEPVAVDRDEAKFFNTLSFDVPVGGGDVLCCDIGATFATCASRSRAKATN